MHDSPRSVLRYEVRAVEYARMGVEVGDRHVSDHVWPDEATVAAWEFYNRHPDEDHSVYVNQYSNGVLVDTYPILPKQSADAVT